ncbi:hypothetical protein HQQ80_16225, partial [Microbacteriaceae bacterium VKM Ac-2855]|nr:hypothetical protein [Microbacteriaceae bacterium VKM Ac-2855]
AEPNAAEPNAAEPNAAEPNAAEPNAAEPNADPTLAARLVGATAAPVGRVLDTYRTEQSIYGTVLVSALIAVGWNDETDLDVLVFMLGTVGVFWLAHVYAGAVSRLHGKDGAAGTLAAIIEAARHSLGMVVSMLLPSLLLLLAVVGWVDEYVAYYLALWSGVVILAVLGFVSSTIRGRPLAIRFLGALTTAALGLGIIWLSALVH